MSNRKESLRRIKRLAKATRGHTFERQYTMDGEEQEVPGHGFVWLMAGGIACVVVIVVLCVLFFGSFGEEKETKPPETMAEESLPETPIPTSTPDTTIVEIKDPTESYASFLQGPRGWKKKIDWAGYWGDAEFDGRRFGGFGCGLCVMANFYCSLTPYQCSPIDMYRYAKKNSSYEGAGAIDWPQIRKVLNSLGFTVDIGRRPKKLADFRSLIEAAQQSMVVVSSYYDNSFWKTTSGHYITILAYDKEKDKIFLGDSGEYKHNRRWIPLKTVFKAVKKSNTFHYLRVLSYDEAKDMWKHKKISGKWYKPDYWKK